MHDQRTRARDSRGFRDRIIELRGDVIGCERIVLGTRAKVFGNIEARNLTIREGAYFEGGVRMTGISDQK